MRIAGLVALVVGYSLTIIGAWILYRYAVPDLGAHGNFAMPPEWLGDAEDAEDVAAVRLRAKRNRTGFFLVVIGTAFQLAGTVCSALLPLR